MHLLLATALALFAGLMMTRVFKYCKLNFPDVTAFLIAGVLVGPFVLGKLGIHGIGFTSLDDAVGLVVFSVSIGIAQAMTGGEIKSGAGDAANRARFQKK